MKDYWPEKWDQNRQWSYQVKDSLRRTALSNNGKRHDNEQYWNVHPTTNDQHQTLHSSRPIIPQGKHQRYIRIVHHC